MIHSEMPQQTQGKMRGFQLWINLPASEKLSAPDYKDIPPSDIVEFWFEGITVKPLLGQAQVNEQTVTASLQLEHGDPCYLDLQFDGTRTATVSGLKSDHTQLIYVADGNIHIGKQQSLVTTGQLARLEPGDITTLTSDGQPARALLICGSPYKEPIAQYGPFVMNHASEIDQAMRDYRDGTLTEQASQLAS